MDIWKSFFPKKRRDTWYISHFWTANQKLWTEEQEATQWAMGLGILETANCALVHLARWKKPPSFSDFPERVLRIIARTLHQGRNRFDSFFLAKSIERFCLGSRSTGRCCLFLQCSTFLRPKWTFLLKKKVGFHHQMGLPPRVEAAHGLRNSLLVAPMPTASTAQILGNNESFEPYTQNLYVRRVLSGEFVQARKNLKAWIFGMPCWVSVTWDFFSWLSFGGRFAILRVRRFMRVLQSSGWEKFPRSQVPNGEKNTFGC